MTNSVSDFKDLYAYEEVAQSLYDDICGYEPLSSLLDTLGVEGGFLCVADQFGSVLARIRFGEESVFSDADEAMQAAIDAAGGVTVGAFSSPAQGLSSRGNALTGVRYEPGALRGFHHILSCRLNGFNYDALTPDDRVVLTDLSELFVLAFCLRLKRDCQIKEMIRDMVVGILSRYCSTHAKLFDPFLEGCRKVLA